MTRQITRATRCRQAIIVRLRADQPCPPYYGLAWTADYDRVRVCMPVPLNLIARAWKKFHFWWLRTLHPL